MTPLDGTMSVNIKPLSSRETRLIIDGELESSGEEKRQMAAMLKDD